MTKIRSLTDLVLFSRVMSDFLSLLSLLALISFATFINKNTAWIQTTLMIALIYWTISFRNQEESAVGRSLSGLFGAGLWLGFFAKGLSPAEVLAFMFGILIIQTEVGRSIVSRAPLNKSGWKSFYINFMLVLSCHALATITSTETTVQLVMLGMANYAILAAIAFLLIAHSQWEQGISLRESYNLE